MNFSKQLLYSTGDLLTSSETVCVLLNDVYVVDEKETFFDNNPYAYFKHNQFEPAMSNVLCNGKIVKMNSGTLQFFTLLEHLL